MFGFFFPFIPIPPCTYCICKTSNDWYKEITNQIIFQPDGFSDIDWDNTKITKEEFLRRRDNSICLTQTK